MNLSAEQEKMMTYEELIKRLDPTVYQNLRTAVELGKWPDGRVITPEQQAICMEAVIYYENEHNVPEAQRVGYLDRTKSDGSTFTCGSGNDAGSDPDPDSGTVRIFN